MALLDRILECVSIKFELEINEIKGVSRRREICEARSLFCLISRELTINTFNSIAQKINRNHATALHAIKKGKDLINICPKMQLLYNAIKDEITME